MHHAGRRARGEEASGCRRGRSPRPTARRQAAAGDGALHRSMAMTWCAESWVAERSLQQAMVWRVRPETWRDRANWRGRRPSSGRPTRFMNQPLVWRPRGVGPDQGSPRDAAQSSTDRRARSLGLRVTRVKLSSRTPSKRTATHPRISRPSPHGGDGQVAALATPLRYEFRIVSRSRSCRFSILPLAVLGISSTISTRRGYL